MPSGLNPTDTDWLVLSVIDAYCDMLYLLSQTELSCSYKSDNNSREGHSTLP